MRKLRFLPLCGSICLLVILLLVFQISYDRRKEVPAIRLAKLQRTDISDSNQSWQPGQGIELLATKDDTIQSNCQQANHLDYDLDYWKNNQVHQKVLADKNFKPLTKQQAQKVDKLLFFTGYPRSGHSIIGSLLDAHPSIILSYAFFLFRRLLTPPGMNGSIEGLLQNKTLFFNMLYERSYHYSFVSRKKSNKGYTLDVPGMWSGKFRNLKIIGDKSALSTTVAYSSASHSLFKQRYEHLAECVGTELVTIHVIRNPFDMIATHTLYRAMSYSWKKNNETLLTGNKLIGSSYLLQEMEFFFDKAEAVKEMVPMCGMKVLEVHIENVVRSPRKEMQRLCKFLDVDFSEQYLQTCEQKIFKNVSRTRDKVVWPTAIKAEVERRMELFPFFKGYTFKDDFYNPA